jgi:hypothetical protein
MDARLRKRWEWIPDGEPRGFSYAASADSIVLGFSRNMGVAAIDIDGSCPRFIWSHPNPPGEFIHLEGAVGGDGPGAELLFVTFQASFSTPILRCLRVTDGSVQWDCPLGHGGAWIIAADNRFAYVLHSFGTDRRIRVFEGANGKEVWAIEVRGDIENLLAAGTPDGRILYAGRSGVIEHNIDQRTNRALTAVPLARSWPAITSCLVGDGPLVFEFGRYIGRLIDCSTDPPVIRWRVEYPDRVSPIDPSWVDLPDLGTPVYDVKTGALFAYDLAGWFYCIDAFDGSIRWVSGGLDGAYGQCPGVPAVLHNEIGSFVLFPGGDGSLYLVDAVSGDLLDQEAFEYPMEEELHTRPTEPVVVVPGEGLLGFEIVSR